MANGTVTTDVPLETLYRTSTMLEGMVDIPRASVFLRDRLFSNVVASPSDQVAIEYYRGRSKLAPFCQPV